MIPLHQLVAPLNCQFTLSANDDAIYYGTGAGVGAVWQILNAELVLQFVEIDDDKFNHSDPTVPRYIASKTYRQVSSTLAKGSSGQQEILVGLRCASLTQLIARFRNQASATQGANGTASYRLGSSVSPNLNSYYWRVGNEIIPRKPVYLQNGVFAGTGAESYAEVSKSFHGLGSSLCNGSITHHQYNVIDPSNNASSNWITAYGPLAKTALTGPDTANNAFSISTELEVFSNRSDTILTGLSTLNAPVYLSLNIQTGTSTSYVVDIFGQMDVVLVIEQGVMRSVF
jgi:hypothetical protein